MVQDEQEHHQSKQSMSSSLQDQQGGWAKQKTIEEYDSSARLSEYTVMAIKRKQNVVEKQVPNARVLAVESGCCGSSAAPANRF